MGNLTKMQNIVMGLVCEGLTDDQIGAKLFIAERTVQTHKKNARVKLNSRTIAQACVVWFKEKNISIDAVKLEQDLHRANETIHILRTQLNER